MKQDFFSGKKKWFFIFLYFSDLLAYFAAALIISQASHLDLLDAFYIKFLLFSFLILMVIYSNYNLYKDKRNLFDDTDVMNIIYSSIITFLIIAIFLIMFDPADLFLLKVLAFSLIISIALTSIFRIALYKIVLFARKKGYDIRKTVYFGESDNELIEKLKNGNLGYKLIKITHSLDELKKYLKRAEIVFIKSESVDEKMLELMINNDSINWKIISSVLNLVIEPVAFDEFRDYPIINISNKDTTKGYKKLKRVIDIIVSGFSLIVLSPLFLTVAILIKMFMPGPIFYRQERLGQNLKPFMLYKFRSMVMDADAQKSRLKNEVKGLFKVKNDPRITKLGKFLRRTCIDELPQLINVFYGDMSIVGPRPHLENELKNFQGWRMARFRIKPGLTGLWQVNGRHELNFDKAVLYDIYYLQKMSLFLDIQIVLKTIPAIIMTQGRY